MGLSALRAATEVEEAEAVARAFLVALYQNDKDVAAGVVLAEDGLEDASDQLVEPTMSVVVRVSSTDRSSRNQ